MNLEFKRLKENYLKLFGKSSNEKEDKQTLNLILNNNIIVKFLVKKLNQSLVQNY